MDERRRIIAEGLHQRERPQRAGNVRGIDRIEIKVLEGLTYEARNPHEPAGLMRIGEPVDRGGDGTGSSPLSHFLTGAGACLLNQFVRIATAEQLPLQFGGASVRGEFGREAGGRMQRIQCEIRASGSIDPASAERLVARAERLCYVHQTLIGTVEMTTVLVVNGTELARHSGGPG